MKFMTIPFALAICIFFINSAYCKDDADVEGKLAQLLRNLNVDDQTPSSSDEGDDGEVEAEVDEKSLDVNNANVNGLTEDTEEARAITWYRRRVCFYWRIFGRRRRICLWLRLPCRG